MAYITCKNLVLGYEGNAVSPPVNFSLEKGGYLCILGENGSGKTTLVRTLVGLQKKISGQILAGDGLKKNEIGYLPQRLMVQKNFPASVWEVVISGTLLSGKCGPFYRRKQKMLAVEQMERTGISSLRRRKFSELSGGQQQRVLLARALCAAQKLLILDEPVAALDPDASAEFYSLLKKLNREGLAVAMVSHDLNSVGYADHVLCFHRENVFWGTKDEFLSMEKRNGAC
ncbi:metal ABC transporter ATP-binding protein [Treponema sp.]|uniref:metal ABC transporter ATP-binding protein n=1 Tax=Treponema sp. TaxID=166 RepID=UPI003F0840FA